MSRDTGLADRLRAMGVPTVEVDGWQTRGSSDFAPHGSVNHHTAGGPDGATPSLGTVTNGRPDLAGPLAQVLQSREPGEGNDKAYVVAAGRANHAGSGGWMGLSGNSSVYGLEIEHTGTEPLPMHRQETAARIHAAMFGGDPSYLCQHREWAEGRKIDAAENVDADEFRGLYAQALAGGFAPQEEEAEMMFTVIAPNDGRPFGIGAPGYWLEGNAEQVQLLADLGLAKFPWTPVDARGYDVARDLFLRGGPAEVWSTMLPPNLVDGQRYPAGDTLLYIHAEAHLAAHPDDDAPPPGGRRGRSKA